MNRFTAYKLVPLAVAVCVAAGASASFAQTTAKKETTTTSKKSTATTVSQSGTIQKFDPATRMLSLSTSKGVEQLTLGPTAKVEESSKAIDVASLEKLTGHKATVRYSEASGSKVVESVHVAAKASSGSKAKKS